MTTIESHARISVAQVAEMCGVNRNTVGLWIRSGKLHAERKGRNYRVRPEELAYFLESSQRAIPEDLDTGHPGNPSFHSIQNCWQYYPNRGHENDCRACAVFQHRSAVCFTCKGSGRLRYGGTCHDCGYFQETFLPRMQFINQLVWPAAVYKDFAIWSANPAWAALCGISEADLIGCGIEDVLHAESLVAVMAGIKRRAIGELPAPRTEAACIRHTDGGQTPVEIAIYPMNEPPGAWLMVVDRVGGA